MNRQMPDLIGQAVRATDGLLAKSVRSGRDTDRLRLISIAETAAILSLSRSSVNRILNSGRLPSVRILGSRRIRVRDIEVFLDDLANAEKPSDAVDFPSHSPSRSARRK